MIEFAISVNSYIFHGQELIKELSYLNFVTRWQYATIL